MHLDLLIHTSVLSSQLKKLRLHNKSAVKNLIGGGTVGITTAHQTPSEVSFVTTRKSFVVFLKKNQNAPRPSEHAPVRGKKCQNV